MYKGSSYLYHGKSIPAEQWLRECGLLPIDSCDKCDKCDKHDDCNCCASGSTTAALKVAEKIGSQVNIHLKSGKLLEGVIVERLWPTSFRVWLEPAEPVEPGEDIDKAIVATHAVAYVSFNLQEPENDAVGFSDIVDECCLEGIREALELAKFTRQSVNVRLNRAGESVTIEGFIQFVSCKTFTILLEETMTSSHVLIEEVEYVEYS